MLLCPMLLLQSLKYYCQNSFTKLTKWVLVLGLLGAHDKQREAGLALTTEDLEFEQLFQEYQSFIEGFFAKRGCGNDTSDLAQQTFVKAYRNREKFRGEVHAKVWLTIIARNLWKNYLRHRESQSHGAKHEVPLVSEIMPGEPRDHSPSPLERLLASERLSRQERLLAQMVLELPPKMRQCVYFRYYQHMKHDTIAKVMRLNINTVKSHLNQARTKLKRMLQEHEIELDFGGTS